MSEENQNESQLNDSVDDVTMASTGNTGNAAGIEPPEDAVSNGYRQALKQQTALVNSLIAQNKSLTDQITQLIRNGASIQDESGQEDPNDGESLPDDYVPLAELGKELGKKKKE